MGPLKQSRPSGDKNNLPPNSARSMVVAARAIHLTATPQGGNASPKPNEKGHKRKKKKEARQSSFWSDGQKHQPDFHIAPLDEKKQRFLKSVLPAGLLMRQRK